MKLALIVLLDRFADWELGYIGPMFNSSDLSESRWRSQIVARTEMTVSSMGRIVVVPNMTVSEVPDCFDALILIGGQARRTQAAKDILPLIDKARALSVPVAAICDAANFLGWHGYLNDVRHTGNAGGEMATYEGTKYTNEDGFDKHARAVTDGLTVTADGASPRHFAEHVARLLKLYPDAEIDEWARIQDIGEKAYFEGA